MNIIFMGTPEFAVPSLDMLLQSEHQVVGVVTVPDKPSGRGLKLAPSAVKRYVEPLGLDLAQPQKLRDSTFLKWLKNKNADLYVVVAFKILPPQVFEKPPLGTINLHASLLPSFRGAAPINWAIINGETKTGVTTFFTVTPAASVCLVITKPPQRQQPAPVRHIGHTRPAVANFDRV